MLINIIANKIGALQRSGGSAPPSVYTLDAVPNAALAFAYRKLLEGYTGNANTLNRSADSATQAVGFVGSAYDETTYTTFKGAGTVSNRVWNDQSGNGKDASQTTKALQAEVLLNQSNTIPAQLGAVNKEMTFTTVSLGTTYDIFGVIDLNDINSGTTFVLGGFVTPFWVDILFYDTTKIYHGRGAGGGDDAANGSFDYSLPKTSYILVHIRRTDDAWASLTVTTPDGESELVGWFPLTNNSPLSINRLTSEAESLNKATYSSEQIYYTRGLSGAEVNLATKSIAYAHGWTVPSTFYVTDKQITRLSASVGFTWRDGVGLVYYDTDLYILGGWDSTVGSYNTFYKSTDGGVSFSLVGTAGWSVRHNFGCGVKDGLIYVWGADLQTPTKDVWTYNGTTWTELTSNWGTACSTRYLYGACVHNNKIFLAGGQLNFASAASVVPYTDVWVFNMTSLEMEKVGDLPVTYNSTGCLFSFDGDLYYIGGCRYIDAALDNYNDKVCKSTDDGVTWSIIATIPSAMIGSYQNAYEYDGRMYFLMGGNTSAVNAIGLWSSADGITWVREQHPSARHAAGICNSPDGLHIVAGNEWNDSWLLS